MTTTDTPVEDDPYTLWTNIPDDELTLQNVKDILETLQDDLWVAAACADRILDDVDIQQALIELGLSRTEAALERTKASNLLTPLPDEEEEQEQSEGIIESLRHDTLVSYFSVHSDDAELCRLRSLFFVRQDKLKTYVDISKNMSAELIEGDDLEEVWDDDPWADSDGAGPSQTKPTTRKLALPPIPLSVFLTQHPSLMAFALAALSQFPALQVLLDRHSRELFSYRFAILDRIPSFVECVEYRTLLPAVDEEGSKELVTLGHPWRDQPDWTEKHSVQKALHDAGFMNLSSTEDLMIDEEPLHPNSLDSEQIRSWYRSRVDQILESSGLVDTALSLIQHGVSQGVSGLDELGEDLTLISRLIYDSSLPPLDGRITISEWQAMSPTEVVKKYLSNSSPDNIVYDIQALVMPYLFVLESRCERAGKPDPFLTKRYLYEYILNASLEMVAPIFEASKPTLGPARRLISDDEDLARLALACLYGSNSLDEWSTMSHIFECLPAWSFESGPEDEDEADATITSLSAFLAPSTARPQCSPSDLLIFFKPLPAQSLSRALDILDVHLESGEILAKWGVAVPLRWLLQSTNDEAQQRSLATKMARQTDTNADDLENEEDWLSLLDDMLKICKLPDSPPSNSAFGSLTTDEIRQIFFRGLLSTGNIPIAKALIRARRGSKLLPDEVIETLSLECSREFYDNASSGNYNFGDMKLAYDCLSVASPTETIQNEREFIEATSRISSYNLQSRPGVPILPIEIRLTKDRLSLVSRILSSNETAYKHTEVILDLMRKLGFHGDLLAEVKTLAMLADASLQAEDFSRAFEVSERMIDAVVRFKEASLVGKDDLQVQEAIEVCWVACFQLGRQSEADNVEKRLMLLGRALELCPPDKIADVLQSWRRLESESIDLRKEKQTEMSFKNIKTSRQARQQGRGRTSTLASRLQNIHMPSPSLRSAAPDAAALASHAFSSIASAFPFSARSLVSEGSLSNRSNSRDRGEVRAGSPDVQMQARQVLQRGIGWLIGADEDELS